MLCLSLDFVVWCLQCVCLDGAVAGCTRNRRSRCRLYCVVFRTATISRAHLGHQQIHQETSVTRRRRQQRTVGLSVSCAFRQRAGKTFKDEWILKPLINPVSK